MPKKTKLEPHLPPEELEGRYRGAKDPLLRSHYQILWLMAAGKSTGEVMEVTGYCSIRYRIASVYAVSPWHPTQQAVGERWRMV
jgi:hypothetical protein